MPRRAAPPVRPAPDITTIARALADASRVAMLDALLDGAAHPIGELARAAEVTAQTATHHVQLLAAQHLVVSERAGRAHHVRLAGPEVAELLERLAALAEPDALPPSRLARLRFARTCYDHLAGLLGVVVTGALVERGWLVGDALAPSGELLAWLAARGAAVPDGRRPLARACLDWSERVPHVAGRVGAALASLFLARRWVVRVRGDRALRLSDRGRDELARELAIRLPAPATGR
jgi:DNA-binding transcriptional ArsR family regulator